MILRIECIWVHASYDGLRTLVIVDQISTWIIPFEQPLDAKQLEARVQSDQISTPGPRSCWASLDIAGHWCHCRDYVQLGYGFLAESFAMSIFSLNLSKLGVHVWDHQPNRYRFSHGSWFSRRHKTCIVCKFTYNQFSVEGNALDRIKCALLGRLKDWYTRYVK